MKKLTRTENSFSRTQDYFEEVTKERDLLKQANVELTIALALVKKQLIEKNKILKRRKK